MNPNPSNISRRLKALPQGLQAHCQQVSRICLILAHRFGADPEKARLAGLVHDIARTLTEKELLALAQSYRLAINEVERKVPLLLHGPVGAEILRRDLGITDPEVLQAVSCHTTGRKDMSLLDKVVFLADKIEPGKSILYPEIDRVRELADKDLDQAVVEFLSWQIELLARNGSLLHLATVEARNSLLLSSP